MKKSAHAARTSLGEMISTFYEEFLAVYHDPDMASVATAAVINDLLAGTPDAVLPQAA